MAVTRKDLKQIGVSLLILAGLFALAQGFALFGAVGETIFTIMWCIGLLGAGLTVTGVVGSAIAWYNRKFKNPSNG